MNIVFFGSSEFAVPALEALCSREKVGCVVTQPDKKKGRSLRIDSTCIKKEADRLGIETFQPSDVNSPDALKRLKKIAADLFIVVSFGQILSRELLQIPKFYCLNVHASLLPKYRGAAPINWAIANGEQKTGVTIIKMNEKMDQGDILLSEEVSIDSDDDALTLSRRLSDRGAELLLEATGLIKKDAVTFDRQTDEDLSYAPKLKKEDGLIDWRWDADKIHNRVRAFIPWPGCFSHWNDKILKIWRTSVDSAVSPADAGPGVVLGSDKDGISVNTGRGVIKITELQLEGKRQMTAKEFIAGHKELTPGVVLKNA